MYKIGFVGGPCSGKTKCLPLLKNKLQADGYKVFIIEESATEISLSGIVPSDDIPMQFFQECILRNQLFKEEMYQDLEKIIDTNKIIFLFDRTIMDGQLYLPEMIFNAMLYKYGLDRQQAFDRYNMIIHMTTVADKLRNKYEYQGSEHCKNSARRETPEEAIIIDKNSKKLFSAHKNFHIIENFENVNDKINYIYELIKKNIEKETKKEE